MNNHVFGLRRPSRMGRMAPFAVAVALLALFLVVTPSWASPVNQPPPAGAILDLSGLPIPNTLTLYSVTFTATLSNTDFTFAFRNDPSFLEFSNPTLVDVTTSSGNLFLDSGFTSNYTSSGNSATPVGWNYANVYGAVDGGVNVGGGIWSDGAVQAYDALDQTVATTPGDVYTISFLACCGSGGNANWSALSTNGNVTGTGGNGIDILAYAQAGLPAPGGTVPEPSTIVLLLAGLAVLFFAAQKKGLPNLA